MRRLMNSGLIRTFSEEAASKVASIPLENEETIFDKIVQGKIPCNKVYEDDLVLAFRDISPMAPAHIVLIPKARDGLTSLSAAEPRHQQILGHLVLKASQIAQQENLSEGWRLISNVGKHGCQSVYHLHFHIIGGRQLTWSH